MTSYEAPRVYICLNSLKFRSWICSKYAEANSVDFQFSMCSLDISGGQDFQ